MFGSTDPIRAARHAAACLVVASAAHGQDTFTRPVVPPPLGANGQFGASIALGDGVVVFGAPGDSARGAQAGGVYTYQRDPGTGGLTLDQVLLPPQLLAFDRFGGAVALDGNVLAVGATGDDDAAPNAGAVYVFTRFGPTEPFALLAELTPPPAQAGVGDRFGASVAVQAGRVAVGAPLDDGGAFDGGAVYVYDVDPVLAQVTPAGDVRDPLARVGDGFGWSVALDGDRLVVGAPRLDAPSGSRDVGGVLIFEDLGAGAWTHVETLLSSRPRRDGDFGFAVALDRPAGGGVGTLVVGEPLATTSGAPRGAVHVFEALPLAAWTHVADHGYEDPRTGLRRGERVAVAGEVVLASIPDQVIDVEATTFAAVGGVELLRRDGGGTWELERDALLPTFEEFERAGLGLAFDGAATYVGAPGWSDGSASNVGRVWASSIHWAGLGGVECAPAAPNSSGTFASLAASGSTVAADGSLVLEAGFLPPGEFVLPLVGSDPAFFTNPGGSQGNLCLGVSIGRFLNALVAADANGRVTVPVDLAAVPQPTGPVAVAAGQTWYFQVWYRDRNPGVTSNYTTSLAVTFE